MYYTEIQEARYEKNIVCIVAVCLYCGGCNGRGVVAIQGGDHAGSGTSATLEITFEAKGSTVDFGGAVPVSVFAGARYKGGFTATEQFDFLVNVP